MTENEALKLGKSLYENITSNANNIIPTKEYIDFVGMAIKAIEEIQQYRAIGTVEECRVAVEKMKPKKPYFSGDGYWNGELVYDTWTCPNCSKSYEVDYEEHDYCPNCGQKIDWDMKGE